jgi:cold shock CspA family protein
MEQPKETHDEPEPPKEEPHQDEPPSDKGKMTFKNNFLLDDKFIGLTKWFNEKSGFGFISYPYGLVGVENGTKDIFVHYSNINPINKESYKALHMGEYVEFKISNIGEISDDKEIRTQAVNVTGVGGGMLMNEYRTYISKMNGENVKKNNLTSFSNCDEMKNNLSFQGKGMGSFQGKGHGKGFGKGQGRGKGQGTFQGKGSKHPHQSQEFGKENTSFSGKLEKKDTEKEEWTPR